MFNFSNVPLRWAGVLFLEHFLIWCLWPISYGPSVMGYLPVKSSLIFDHLFDHPKWVNWDQTKPHSTFHLLLVMLVFPISKYSKLNSTEANRKYNRKWSIYRVNGIGIALIKISWSIIVLLIWNHWYSMHCMSFIPCWLKSVFFLMLIG